MISIGVNDMSRTYRKDEDDDALVPDGRQHEDGKYDPEFLKGFQGSSKKFIDRRRTRKEVRKHKDFEGLEELKK